MESAARAVSDKEIRIERIFDAPRGLVWEAWTDPEHIAKWWGPNGFTTTTSRFDFRVGGQWLHTMHGPDGTDYPNEVTYTAITEPERIEYDHGPGHIFQVTVRFDTVENERTRLSMRMLFPTQEQRDFTIREFGAVEGLTETIGRLEEYLARTTENNLNSK